MHSCAQMNGQYRQIGPPSQSSQAATQFTHDPMWSQQVGTANNLCQYRTSNTVVQPLQSAHVTFRDGAYFNRQMSNWQTSAVPHQAVSSQLPAGEKTNSSYLTVLHGNLQNSFTNTQSGNPPNSGFISSSSPPNMMKANTSYPQQDMSAHWNQRGSNVVHWRQSKRTLDGKALPNFRYSELMKTLLQNRNGELTKPPPPYPATPTSLPHKQVVRSSTLVSATAHNRQTAYDQNNRQNGTQHGFSPSIPSSNYSTVVSQSFGNGNITANSSSSEQVFHVSSISQKTQQYPIHINSAHNREETTRHFLSETNENSSANKQEQDRIIARIAEDLQNSFTESSDCHPPAYTPATYRGNSNASQSLPLSSGLSLTKTTNSVMSRTQHSVDVPPQQSSAPNAFYVSATGDGSGNVFFPESNRAENGNIAGSLSDASQLMKLLEGISPQRNKTRTSVANNSDMHEILEKLSSAKANDSTVHSSPGRTGMRAVAVVQPLSQECYQVASKHTTNTINQSAEYIAPDESLNNPEKLCISPAVEKTKKDLCLREGSNLYPENPNQMTSIKYVISDSAASNDGTCLSDSAGHQEVSQSQLCTDDTGSEVAINMDVDQSDTPAAPQPVTSEVPLSQNGDEDKNENSAELSSVPTIPWTTAKLMKFIQNAENVQRKLKRNLTDLSTRDSVKQIFGLFWDDEIKNISHKLKMGWYKNLNANVVEFLREHLTPDTVILSQVKDLKRLKNCYVLKDDDIYSEPPYKSKWLNVNEQLDDIDKEFGFPWSLKHRLHILESQQDQVGSVDSIPAQIASDAPNSVLSQTELEPPEDKQDSTVEATPIQDASPNDTESVDSSDPYYSFEIQVLPPEDAKLIFEQVQSKMPQSRDTDSQPEGVMNSSLEAELPVDTDVTLNDSDFESESVCPIAQVCCITRLQEMFYGSNTPSLSTCQCKNDQSLKEFTDNTLDKEEMAVHKELCGELSQTFAVTENGNSSPSHSDKKSKNISRISINGSLPTIILISEDEDLSSSDTEIQSNPEEDCKQGLKSPGSTQSCVLVSSDKEIEKLPSSEGEVASQVSDLEETCGQARLTSTDAAESSSSETAEQHQTTFSLSREHETVERKWKRESSNDRFFPIFKKANKYNPPVDVDSQPSSCRKVLSDATDGEPSASNVRAVQLVLFGSAPQDKCVLIGSRRSHMSSPGVVSDGVPGPPEVVSVKLSPLKRKSSETVQTGELSVKRRIHEKWRSFLPTKIGHRGKLKTQKRNFASLSGAGFKKAETTGPTNTEKLPVSNETRTWNQNTKRCRSLKWRRALSDRLRHAEVKMKKRVGTIKQPADGERSNTEKGRYTVTRLPDKNVLRFSVLPNTFNLMEQDGFSETTDTEDPDLDKPDPVEEKDKCSNKTILREKGTWYPNPEKKYCPLRSPPVPKTSIVFREFQRKYMEKMQPSFDE